MKSKLLISRIVLGLALIFSVQSIFSQCTIDTAATGGDNEMTGSELVAYINTNSCSGTLVIESPVDILIDADVTIPAVIDRLEIRDGGQIIWTSNSTLTLAPNSAIIIENTTDIFTQDGTGALATVGPCNNNRRINIGGIEYAACVGGGNVCIIFSDLIEAGGTIQIDPDFGAIDGTDDQVCFTPTQLEVIINGFAEGVPTFDWTVITVPAGVNSGDVLFVPNPTTQNPIVEVPEPGVYVFRISVTVPLSVDCLDQTVTVFTDITVEFLPTIQPDILTINPGSSGCGLDIDFEGSASNIQGTSATYAWDFGDGSTSNLMEPTHTYASPGTYTVTLTVVDNGGLPECNTASISQDVIVTDSAPTISCPDDITVNVDAGECFSTVTLQNPTITDDCTVNDINITNNAPANFPVGVTVVTWTYTDTSGNTDSCEQSVTVIDNEAPTIDTEASNETVECDGLGNTTELNNWLTSNGGATASDCSSITWTNDFTSLSDLCGATGSATVTFTATDNAGNSAITSAIFTIEDTTPPTLTAPNDISIECDQDPDDISIAGSPTGGFDACGGYSIGYSDVNSAYSCFGNYTITRTWTATDECGNITSVDQTITVEDTTDPVLADIPADITAECDNIPAVGSPTATDNCDASVA
ncbi:MAG: PKD domain-containing protein, partial [Flavobacteriaceae bacterium]|nr:PKD domain-containing protein [Flavobacteriaceae bacterium]